MSFFVVFFQGKKKHKIVKRPKEQFVHDREYVRNLPKSNLSKVGKCDRILWNGTAVLCGTQILRYVVALLLNDSLSLHTMVWTLRNDVLI